MCALPSMTQLSRTGVDFIDDDYLTSLLKPCNDAARIGEIIAKSLSMQALSVEETASLLMTDKPDLVEAIFQAARDLKQKVYGNRIVLFAPLYIGNNCINDCRYCGFRLSNPEAIRRTLSNAEIVKQIEGMVSKGHKRTILVFGEHPMYDANYIADCVRLVYTVKAGHGEMRRVNINAAPLDHEGFKTVKAANIGTYQIFQETYHHATYAECHPAKTRKSNYLYRLDALSRAMECGIDDVGIGALFGLGDWRFEALGLVSHALHLQKEYGCGPHTVSFPRMRPASGVVADNEHWVSDADFKRMIAILRLAVPYTGLICTARETPEFRREVMAFGVSQIDAGSRVDLGGYTEAGDAQQMQREQFQLGDIRPLDEVVRELIDSGHIPSWCTACYRVGRTGEHFMEFAIPGFIKRFCTPNALSTLTEYLVDYATPETRSAGMKIIAEELAKMQDTPQKAELVSRLERIKSSNDRDLYF
jgi:2-iminoacetate synthase